MPRFLLQSLQSTSVPDRKTRDDIHVRLGIGEALDEEFAPPFRYRGLEVLTSDSKRAVECHPHAHRTRPSLGCAHGNPLSAAWAQNHPCVTGSRSPTTGFG